ncbi:hypothetical protein ECZU34_49660 [Escherichia coli]|nr:hypothetical protein ECZU34_49660 [Escherichia coli]
MATLVSIWCTPGIRSSAAARHVDRLAKLQLANVSCHKVDLSWPDNLPALLQDIDTVYFLVHSMGEGGDFIAQERRWLSTSAMRYVKSQLSN